MALRQWDIYRKAMFNYLNTLPVTNESLFTIGLSFLYNYSVIFGCCHYHFFLHPKGEWRKTISDARTTSNLTEIQVSKLNFPHTHTHTHTHTRMRACTYTPLYITEKLPCLNERQTKVLKEYTKEYVVLVMKLASQQ